MSYLSCSSRLSVTAAAMWAAALLALAVTALSQGAACRLPAFPAWRCLHGGGRHSYGGGWFARTVELLAAVPVLLVAPSCLVAAASPVVRGHLSSAKRTGLPCSAQRFYVNATVIEAMKDSRTGEALQPSFNIMLLCCPLQARQLRPYSATRLRGATNAALLYCACLAALLAVCACLLLGSSVQVGWKS